MVAVRKKFSRRDYEAFDGPAKDALTRLLKTRGHKILDTSETYYADVVSTKGGYTYHSEAEVKVSWKGPWPESWGEIRIPERKNRLLKKHKDDAKLLTLLNFYVFRKDFKQCWRIKGTALTEDRIKEPAQPHSRHLNKETGGRKRHILKGELFYHIPYPEAELINL